MEPSVNTELLRSRVDTFILNSLNEKDGYGYDILTYIQTKTQGHYEMKQSSIYSVLKRLEKQGYIKSYLGDESKGGQRRYYSLTDAGRAFLHSEQQQWAYTRTLLDNLVTRKDFDLEKDSPPFRASDLRPLTRRTRNEDGEYQEEETIKEDNQHTAQDVLAATAEQNEDNRLKAQEQEALAATADQLGAMMQKDGAGTDESISFSSNAGHNPTAAEKTTNEWRHSTIDTEQKPTQTAQAEYKPQQPALFATEHTATAAVAPAQYNDLQKHARERLFSDTLTATEPTEKTVPAFVEESTEKEEKPPYRTLFNKIYDKKPQETKPQPQPAEDELSCRHINDLKNILKNEGYSLKTYKHDEMLCDYSRNRMYYPNKLLRDCSILTFLFYTLTVLIIYRFRAEFDYSAASLLITGLCGLILPLAGLLNYFLEPKKRVKAVFNFRIVFAYSVMAYLLVFVLNLIVSLVTPSISLTLRDAKLYPPIMLALVIPVSVVFYQMLYKSGFYSIKV